MTFFFTVARETYRFSRSPNVCPSIVSQRRASAAGMSKLYRRYLETFIIPARAFGTPRGENDGRDSQVTFRVIPRAIRIRANAALANGLRWALDIFHSTLPTRLAEPRVFHYLYRGSIVARLTSRIVAQTYYVPLPR